MTGGTEGTRTAGRTRRKARPEAEPVAIMPVGVADPAPAPEAGAPSLLETARTRWEHGEWAELLALSGPALETDPERGKLALLIAGAHAQAGDMEEARRLARQALLWGCSRTIVSRVLLSATQNSLARVAAALEEDALPHFEAAIRLVQPNADVALLARNRRMRELARMGLLPDAAAALEQELGLIGSRPAETGDLVRMLQSQIEILRSGLVTALERQQLYRPGDDEAGTTTDPVRSLSTSQLGQDLWVLERSGYRKGGYFVEFGATDGILLSNTFLLERHFGWTGICAEPNPAYFADLKRNRSCRTSDACIGATTGAQVDFVLADEYGSIADYADTDQHAGTREAYRRAGQVRSMQTTSLHDFLTAHGAPREIDYLSIDTEGSEFDILNAFPFDAWRIRFLTVEHNFTPMREKIFDLLSARGYVRTEAQWDDWYELRS